MKRTLLVIALTAASSLALAQGGYGPGFGRGGYGGYGPGMGNEMMMGYHGGGPGAGRGGGYGRNGPLAIADLTDEQREKILAIQEEHRRKNWDTMGQIRSEQFNLRRLYSAEKIDTNAVIEQQKKLDELRRAMFKSRAEQHNQVVAVLTPEQRKQFRRYGPWWADNDD